MNAHTRPNILFIMSDDHASHAMSCYGSRINETPNIDRIANEGMRFDNCFCTNSICSPSRAAILTGMYNHLNGVKSINDDFDGRQMTYPKLLQAEGYQTAIVGKWHLGHGGDADPTGFDYWTVVPGQGHYHDPVFIEMGERKRYPGYVTDLTADFCIDWLDRRDKDRPFMLMCHHKAPHRPWEPAAKYANLYEDIEIPEPETFYDDYSNRAQAAHEAKMRIDRDMKDQVDLKGLPPEGLTPLEQKKWRYQRYIKDYLRCVASIDENVGRLLDYLDKEGLTDNTIVVYTSDQGFFLGDHGWYDKRFMYEESLRMPFVVRYPRVIKPGSVTEAMTLNIDFPSTFLDYAGVAIPKEMQGHSLRPVFEGMKPDDWRTSMYYRYWMHLDEHHNVYSHYGIRTDRYKLIYYYAEALGTSGSMEEKRPPEWELFDLDKDPHELNNVYSDSAYAEIVPALKAEMHALQRAVLDEPVEEIE
ncbi:N-acetylglucosamine-6-O-sulfatase [Paenibacillus solanacearum]|uniref:N-acetylglucosamine-6-O-sulfatase n=1 Tax=Paenibacillus solanacearum TaxID=2048548 RepID=A0A916JX41_9BACL|nr:sulfatase [Paenibacillus solanacearum]CAG7608923.1 N-acetylglucosamine-6-O-sulfatase [Paenibacillus solanacearum]